MKKFLIFLVITVLLYTPFLVYLVHLENRVGDFDAYPTYRYPVYEGDSVEFASLADRLVSNHTFSLHDGEPETFRTPGYPLFVAFFRAMHLPYVVIPFLQMIMVAVTALLMYQIAVRFLGISSRLAWLAGILYILDFTTMFNTILIGTDILFVMLLMVAVYWLLSRRSPVWIAGAGAVLSYGVLVRPVALYLGFLLVLYFVYRRWWKNAIVFGVAFVLVLSPWLVRNKIQTGVIGISSISAYNLLYYNIPPENGFAERLSDISDQQARSLAYSAKLSHLAFSYIKAHPVSYMLHHLSGLPHFFFSSGAKYFFVSGVKAFRSDHIPALLFHLESFVWLVLLLVAFAGLIIRSGRRTILFGFMVIVWYFALVTGPVAVARYRLPASPFLFLLAVSGYHLMRARFNHEQA